MSQHRAARFPGQGAYARVEREQRLLLDAVPPDVVDPVRIEDLYVTGTTLRLRRMSVDGAVVARKLTQKVWVDGVLKLTTMYLRDDEYAAMAAALSGDRLTKKRWSLVVDGRRVAVDELDGLVLAEIELGDGDEPLDVASLPFAATDVSDDDRYTGAALAISRRV